MKTQFQNYQTATKGESISSSNDGKKIFVGTNEGTIPIYQCVRGNTSGIILSLIYFIYINIYFQEFVRDI